MSANYFGFNTHSSKRPKSPFGGFIKSKEEIKKLNTRIKETEKKEFENFDKEFDEQASRIWTKPFQKNGMKKT